MSLFCRNRISASVSFTALYLVCLGKTWMNNHIHNLCGTVKYCQMIYELLALTNFLYTVLLNSNLKPHDKNSVWWHSAKHALIVTHQYITFWTICMLQYIPRNMHTVFDLLCFVVVIHWLIFPYPSGLLHWHCGNLTIAPVPAKQPWWMWINTSCEFIINDCITTTKQSTTRPCAYFLGYTVF